ncbi:MAG: 3'-5' exonuclease, partial [Tannerellaceae bacterium]
RNSDWRLLDEQVQQDFMPEEVQQDTLKENWRSCLNIVEFNNTFFTAAPALLQSFYNETLETSSLTEKQREQFFTKIMSAYDKSYQLVPPPFREKEGHVKVNFISRDEETDWKEEVMNRLPGTLEELQDKGYALKDIAILVRTNQEGALVADTLLSYKEQHASAHYQYDILSDEALFVSGSPSVRFLIALLRHLKNPEDRTNEQLARFAYTVLLGEMTEGDEPFIKAFPPEVKTALRTLARQSLYEISEGLFRLFADFFPDNEQVFVQAFLDMVSEYTQKETADLGRFLKWWDESGYRKTIATPDGQNAIRILTVHKSKGLGFKAMILPFGDWEIDHKAVKPVILWCHPHEKPFNRMRLVPVRYSQGLSNTIFAEDYFDERLHAFIDNLNTLYVAFTRAKEELIVFAPQPKKINETTGEVERINSIADLLWAGLSTEVTTTREGDKLLPLPPSFDMETATFELGEEWRPTIVKTESASVSEVAMSRLCSISPDDRLQLRLHGKGFFFDNAKRKHGALMHEVLSCIRTKADIPASVENYRIEGIINREEAGKLIARLEELLNTPEVENWYNGTSRVLNEIDILVGKETSKRPDRVIITGQEVVIVDYKFGSNPNKRHHKQVADYMNLIHRMGYSKVKGYLWYVELNKIEAV